MEVRAVPFLIHKEPKYVVGYDINQRNLDFLKRFHANYFHETSNYLLNLIDNKSGSSPKKLQDI